MRGLAAAIEDYKAHQATRKATKFHRKLSEEQEWQSAAVNNVMRKPNADQTFPGVSRSAV
jgi:hypothetical protein